ncbi:cyanophycin synthetase [Arcticibacter eurypsychrophilus]|uniref:cyanophycin synthetase n=1 Tax=Arcticibacter eurypsychrophilus TaxID=1434752 RepID=UPI00084D1007|nr:cyanophycin synthetase [Arcticibacter eurypsychrophilus]
MQIQSIQVLKGPNIWSVKRKKLIQMRLDLGEMEYRPSDTISGFKERLQELIPSLKKHHCSEGHEGGFFERVHDGTWMGHIVEHIALEIQTLAGMFAGFGRTRSTSTTGIYNVVFTYVAEQAGIYAAQAAVRIAEALVVGEEYDLKADIRQLERYRDADRFGPSTGAIIDEAVKRKIPFTRLNTASLVQLGQGKNQVRFRATMTDKTSSIAVDIAGNKEETKRLLKEHAIPVADGSTITTLEGLKKAIKEIGFPLVFKPLNGNHGRGATINVNSEEEATVAFELARKISPKVIVERFIRGSDFRVLVINYKVVAAALRKPAHVIGNGRDTIQQLIEEENKNPKRGNGHENVLTNILIDQDTNEMLRKADLTLDYVPAEGKTVNLKSTANISTGGTAVDMTDEIHALTVFTCQRIAKVIGLDICGIDIMAGDISRPLQQTNGVVLEVNAAPGFRMHLAPTEGKPRNVAAPFIDMLYPEGKSSRIPIIAITGTNGKTTTTRLIAHIIKNCGYKVGYTTSDGIYIQDMMHKKGDMTGPTSAAFVLQDPTVEFAVLETARGGILRSGIGFDFCDIAVITNIQEDHLGISDIHTLKDLQRVKSVLVDTVWKNGWAVLNADNPYCVNIGTDTTHCQVAYFSMYADNPVIIAHCQNGGSAAILENGNIVLMKGSLKITLSSLQNVPITYNGSVAFMVQNAMAASLAAYLWGFQVAEIRTSIESFYPSTEQTPGRMNLFEFSDFKILVDYAHNPDGLMGIKHFIMSMKASRRTGVISGTGDRRDDDIRQMGRIAAGIFDHIIICQEKYLRGRTKEEIAALLLEGIKEVAPDKSVQITGTSDQAWEAVLNERHPGELITIISDSINHAYQRVKRYHESLS